MLIHKWLYSTYNYIRALFSLICDQIILTRWVLNHKMILNEGI